MSEFIIVSNDLAPSVIEVSSSGPQGSSGTVSVGTVTTGASGSAAAVTNSGTPSAAVLNFTIPKGDIGDVTPAATAAKNAAEAAATAAAASELAAETAEQSAGTFASNASSSATAASASAATANTKAQEASTSASNAAASAQSVLTAANTATIKAQEADASAYAASLSANTATTKAQEASTSATTADTKAQEAVVSANVATNKAQEASASAVIALSAQQISTENATVAIAQGNLATTKAAEADASANDALVQASIATAQAQEATAQVDLATAQAVISTTQAGISTAQATISTTQADIATTQANTSTAQATIATTQASNAEASAVQAAGSASAALASQVAAAGSATSATNSANSASGSAASALAIYGTTAAQQAALTNAQSAASLAQGYALSASSAIQQDLSGVTAQALHRSPNAVTAMFVYDTSKDSDGGAWTEKCQHTSWYNEALNGKWLGARLSEVDARSQNAVVSSVQLAPNNDFNTDTDWTKGTGVAISDGAARFSNVANNVGLTGPSPLTNGKTYAATFTISGYVTGGISVVLGSNFVQLASLANGTFTIYGTSTGTGLNFRSFTSGALTSTYNIESVSVREVTALTTASGDYYQSTVDGKFYKLNPTSGVTETFRGNKADFPRLAGIVAEAASVTIYDLTEAGRPMWMRFLSTGSNSLVAKAVLGNNNISTAAMLNAVMVIGCSNNSGYQGSLINLLKDKSEYLVNGTMGSFGNTLANRNVTTTFTPGGLALPSTSINAVAMTVLPDAPVDIVSGLQVPTIAVATAGGVSVIKHNGTVVSGGNASVAVAITKDALFSDDSGTNRITYALNPGQLGANFSMANFGSLLPSFLSPSTASNAQRFLQSGRASYARMPAGRSAINLLRNFEATPAKSAVATVSNTFNTGHLIGDIRRAYLADVDVGSVSGTELVTNGTFDTGISGWTNSSVAGGSISWNSGGWINLVNATGNGIADQSFATIVGTTYKVTVSNTTTSAVWVFIGSTAGNNNLLNANFAGIASKQYVFTATTTTSYLRLANLAAGTTTGADNISVKEVVADRSYKAQGANITGTLTKTQVAADAQLVACSGFSAANYLREPYSADLDFGTGEWSASAWVNVPVTLPVESFSITPVAMTMNTADWTKGVGWSCPSADSFSCNGTQTSQSDLVWVATNKTPASSVNRYRWTVTISAITGSLIVYPNNTSPFAITTPGTYYGYGYAGFTILRMSAGSTCTGTLAIDDMAPSMVLDRDYSSGPKVNLGVTATGNLTATAFDGTTTRTVTTAAAYNTATWLKAEADYTTDGTLSISVNGVEVAATRGNPLLTLNNSNAVLTIGNSFAADAPFPGSISLLKLSATVPTAEQSQWMYEQEKQMFRAGAQVTLPDAGSIVDLAYDDATDKWLAVSATNESEWSGLIRTNVTASPAGSYSKISAASGIQLQARTTTNPGVDVTIPPYGLREELVNRSQAAARLARNLVSFDYVGGFTANTTSGSTAITSAANITYPVSYVGARVSATGIPADTFVAAVSATTIYLTKPATATASAVQISFNDFILPVGYEAKDVLLAGVSQREGTTQAFTRLFDGFKETIRFTTAPSNTVLVQIKATRSIQ